MVELNVTNGRICIFTSSPGTVSIHDNDLYDLGYTHEQLNEGVQINIGEVALVIRKMPEISEEGLEVLVGLTIEKHPDLTCEEINDIIQSQNSIRGIRVRQAIWRLIGKGEVVMHKNLHLRKRP